MANYTLTIDTALITYSCDNFFWVFENCEVNTGETANNINDIASLIVSFALAYSGIVTYTIQGTVITAYLTDAQEEYDCGGLIGIQILDNNDIMHSAQWLQTQPCDTCQDITFANCGEMEFSLTLQDALYEFSIEDHQSGVVYQQTIDFAGGVGTWNQTNTSGVFTPFSVYTLTITDENGQPVSWADGDKEYTCARITFVNSVDTNVVT